MVTEHGSVLTEKTTAGEARKALTKNLKWLWIALLIVGAMGLAAYIVVATIWEEVYGYEPKWAEILLILSAIPFAIGLIFTLATRSQKKADLKTDNIKTNSEFFSDCIILREFKDGEQVGVIRIDYSKILRVKRRGEFLYLTITQGIAYPVYLGSLTQEELNTIYKTLKLPAAEGAQILELKECDSTN